jgi:hypothetical protein
MAAQVNYEVDYRKTHKSVQQQPVYQAPVYADAVPVYAERVN